MPSRPTKDLVIYGCIVLNRLASQLGVDLLQEDLEGKIDRILADRPASLSKEQIKQEIRSNHFMTTRVIEALERDGYVKVDRVEGRYAIAITHEGIFHIRRYNEFYKKVYQEQLRDHYRFRSPPYFLRE